MNMMLFSSLVGCFLTVSGLQNEAGPQSSIVILVDISKSFAPLTQVDQLALGHVASALSKEMGNSFEPPTSLYWSVIGNSGVAGSSAVCGTAVYRPRLVKRGKGEEFTNISEVKIWLNECVRAVMRRSQSPERLTDISGAVAMAAETTRFASKNKILIILSDFAEDRGGAASTNFKLAGDIVILLYRAQPTDASNADLLFSRLQDWEARFKEAGASKACRVSILGATSYSIQSCLRR
jgi:hypothetical protein